MLFKTLIAAIVLMGVVPAHAETPEARPPNVVLILTDDQGYGDLGSYGHPYIDSPNIDRLAEEGIRLTDYYAGHNVCTPSRAALLTGSYPRRINMHQGVILPGHRYGLNPDETTAADMLRSEGYATGIFGKWHLGNQPGLFPGDNGFDEWLGSPYSNDIMSDGAVALTPGILDEVWMEYDTSWQWFDVPLIRSMPGSPPAIVERPMNQVTLTDRLTDAAMEFIARNQNRPFFAYVSHPQPHIPLFVGEDFYDPDVQLAYEIVIEKLDESTGRILDQLDELGLAENTIVIFSSDNGPWVGKAHHGGSSGPLRGGKTTTFEGGHRVPFLIRWPDGLPGGETFTGLMTAMDVLPTLAAATGASLPSVEIDGYNLLAALRGNAPSPRETYLYYSVTGVLDGIRRGEWKLHRNSRRLPVPGPRKKLQLYNLRQDPGETTDVSDQYPELVAELLAEMKAQNAVLIDHSRPLARVD